MSLQTIDSFNASTQHDVLGYFQMGGLAHATAFPGLAQVNLEGEAMGLPDKRKGQ